MDTSEYLLNFAQDGDFSQSGGIILPLSLDDFDAALYRSLKAEINTRSERTVDGPEICYQLAAGGIFRVIRIDAGNTRLTWSHPILPIDPDSISLLGIDEVKRMTARLQEEFAFSVQMALVRLATDSVWEKHAGGSNGARTDEIPSHPLKKRRQTVRDMKSSGEYTYKEIAREIKESLDVVKQDVRWLKKHNLL